MMIASTLTQQLLPYALMPGVGPQILRALAEIPDLVAYSPHELARRVPLMARALTGRAWDQAHKAADAQLSQCESAGVRILSRLDPDYPVLLAESPDDPVLLWVKGKLPTQATVAVIGAREATAHGIEIAQRITRELVNTKGFSIVSGLAIGIDTAAHKSALAAQGHTVAVLAHGLHMIAPAENRELAERILEGGGALVSEYPMGRPPKGHQYVQRDRTQAGLAQGVVMVQTDLKGGSLHATRSALAYGRWVAVPYPTKQDLVQREPKIQANLVIAEGTLSEKMTLLRCDESALSHIHLLRSSEDYAHLQPAPLAATPINQTTPRQGSFF